MNTQDKWEEYVKNHPSRGVSDDEWERSYLPANRDELKEVPTPRVPLVLEFPHITRRVAAQRSRFIVFWTDYAWLEEEFLKPESSIVAITIDKSSKPDIRMELRDSGVTESVIFPDLEGSGREISQLWEDQQ